MAHLHPCSRMSRRVFRSLKSELGLRPIHHRKPRRAEGHLFITVIAYQLVQVKRHPSGRARRRTDALGELDDAQAHSRRTSARDRDVKSAPTGRTLHVCKATRPEPQQKAIPDALGIASSAGGTHQTVV